MSTHPNNMLVITDGIQTTVGDWKFVGIIRSEYALLINSPHIKHPVHKDVVIPLSMFHIFENTHIQKDGEMMMVYKEGQTEPFGSILIYGLPVLDPEENMYE